MPILYVYPYYHLFVNTNRSNKTIVTALILTNKAQEYGLNLEPMDFYSYVYPFDKESIKNVAYYFADTNIAAEYSTTMIRWYGKIQERIEAWIGKWNRPAESTPPQLYFKQNGHGTVIYDSRFDKAVEHKLSPLAIV